MVLYKLIGFYDFLGEVSILFGKHKLSNMSVQKGVFDGIDVQNTCKGEFMFTAICRFLYCGC